MRKRLTLQGFIVSDHLDRQAQFYADMAAWMAAGKMHWQETIVNGIENAPQSLYWPVLGQQYGQDARQALDISFALFCP